LQELQRVDAGARGCRTSTGRRFPRCASYRRNCRATPERWTLTRPGWWSWKTRLDLIHSLKHKYGASLAEVIAFGDEAQRRLQGLEQRDSELARLNGELQKARCGNFEGWQGAFRQTPEDDSATGRAAGKQLADLGFQQSKFDVAISTFDDISVRSPAFRRPVSSSSEPPEGGTPNLALRITHSGLTKSIPICAQPRRTGPAAPRHSLLRRNGPRDVGAQDRARGGRRNSGTDFDEVDANVAARNGQCGR